MVGLASTVPIEGARYSIQSNALSPLAYTSMTEGMCGGAVGGRFTQVVVGVTPGWAKHTGATTFEDVHEHLNDICGGADFETPRSLSEEIDIARAMLE